nr:hypothetical protein [Tanacetum cinerariifolium]
MKIKNRPSKRKSIDDSSKECHEKGISKKPRATFPLAMTNTNKPVINSTCLQQKGDPIDKVVGTNIGLSMENTIAKGTPLPKDLSIQCDKRGTAKLENGNVCRDSVQQLSVMPNTWILQ